MDGTELLLRELHQLHTALEAIDARLGAIDAGLTGLSARLDTVEGKIDRLTQAHEETRGGVNALLDWADTCSDVVQFPLPRVE